MAISPIPRVSNYPIPKNRKDLTINWFYDEEKVKEDIRDMRRRCDYLVLSVHAGVEYDHQPQPRDSGLMKKYLDEGADIVIGHHPHVLQPVEKYRTHRRQGYGDMLQAWAT